MKSEAVGAVEQAHEGPCGSGWRWKLRKPDRGECCHQAYLAYMRGYKHRRRRALGIEPRKRSDRSSPAA